MDYHPLARLVHSLAPLARLDDAGGLRSLYRDPRLHPAIRGAPPEDTALDALSDTGVLALARVAWRRLRTLDPAHRQTLRWLADRHGAAIEPAAWALEYGRTHGDPTVRHHEAELRARIEGTERILAATRAHRGALTAERAHVLDHCGALLGQLIPARRVCQRTLLEWGAGRFAAAARAWWGEESDTTATEALPATDPSAALDALLVRVRKGRADGVRAHSRDPA